MEKIEHLYVTVNSDEQKVADFDGPLVDFACLKLNTQLQEYGDNVRVVTICERFWTSEIRPSQCDSSTWYNRHVCQLSVYLARM